VPGLGPGTPACAVPVGVLAGASSRRGYCDSGVGGVPPPVGSPASPRVAFEGVGDANPWHRHQAFEELAEECLRGFLGPTALPENIQPIAVLIHSTPERMAFAIDRHQHLVQGPLVALLGTPATALIRILLPAQAAPVADGCVRHDDPTNEQEFFPSRWLSGKRKDSQTAWLMISPGNR
jgi:hypothetical protein